MISIKQSLLIILDFGSQYTQLIARRIRDIGVYCEIHPYNLEKDTFFSLNPAGVILSGGPASVTCDLKTLQAPTWLFEQTQLPILGICYGMQTMALQLGGEVEVSRSGEFGYAELRLKNQEKMLFHALQDRVAPTGDALLDVWMSHGDSVTKLPASFEILCETESTPIAGMCHVNYPWYGLQFHPEVTQTLQGARILERFVLEICQAKPSWLPHHIIDNLVQEVRNTVGKEHVLLGISGGVDSTVVAALLQKAIGNQLIAIFVDTGLLRAQEKEQVTTMLGEHFNIHLIVVDARDQFLKALKGICCPEEKRKIIGHTFIEVFEKEAKSLPKICWLAQGTIYPDVIESAAVKNGASMVIKSHHNVGGLPATLNLKLLEPIRELFKDEVRKIGTTLGLPPSMIDRHPFPGPGLGVRIMGEVKEEYLEILRQADAIFIEELHEANLYSKVSQAFAVFLPVKSVGVVGDGRRYEYVIALRAVETIDFMTAQWAHLPWDFLAKVSSRIVNESANVSRVIYDISSKPPATIEWE